jgi:hypothetical protein
VLPPQFHCRKQRLKEGVKNTNNCVVFEPEGSTPLMPKTAVGNDPAEHHVALLVILLHNRRVQVEISARRLVILTEACRAFSQSFQANSGIMP